MDTSTKAVDAINMLKQDHRNVEKLFQGWQRATNADLQFGICQEICSELEMHTAIEEQCFYPGIRSLAGLEDMIDESYQEHGQVKQLCGEIRAMSAGQAQLRSMMTELKQAVEHHVKEEESELFPKVRETCDQQWLLGVGQAMQQQKSQMQAQAPTEQRIHEDVRESAPSRTTM